MVPFFIRLSPCQPLFKVQIAYKFFTFKVIKSLSFEVWEIVANFLVVRLIVNNLKELYRDKLTPEIAVKSGLSSGTPNFSATCIAVSISFEFSLMLFAIIPIT